MTLLDLINSQKKNTKKDIILLYISKVWIL